MASPALEHCGNKPKPFIGVPNKVIQGNTRPVLAPFGMLDFYLFFFSEK
jgi:hypothetical protein